jgi:hypothetical protein
MTHISNHSHGVGSHHHNKASSLREANTIRVHDHGYIITSAHSGNLPLASIWKMQMKLITTLTITTAPLCWPKFKHRSGHKGYNRIMDNKFFLVYLPSFQDPPTTFLKEAPTVMVSLHKNYAGRRNSAHMRLQSCIFCLVVILSRRHFEQRSNIELWEILTSTTWSTEAHVGKEL